MPAADILRRTSPAGVAASSQGKGEISTERILLTGATGRIGHIVREHLGDEYRFRLLTRSPIEDATGADVHLGDVADYDAIRPAFDGVDAVIHLAAAAGVDSPWETVLNSNIIGARNVFEAARDAGVARLIFASSTHAVGMYEQLAAPQLYELHDGRVYDEKIALRPDSLYGVSKAFGEVLGRYYSDAFGLSVICLRIGWVGEEGQEPGNHPRAAAIWLSEADCAQLFRRALAARDVRYAVVFATSNNARQFWDLGAAREVLGFAPVNGAPPATGRPGGDDPSRD